MGNQYIEIYEGTNSLQYINVDRNYGACADEHVYGELPGN